MIKVKKMFIIAFLLSFGTMCLTVVMINQEGIEEVSPMTEIFFSIGVYYFVLVWIFFWIMEYDIVFNRLHEWSIKNNKKHDLYMVTILLCAFSIDFSIDVISTMMWLGGG